MKRAAEIKAGVPRGSAPPNPPRAVPEHFRLHYYGAVHWLARHLESLTGAAGLEAYLQRYPYLKGYLGKAAGRGDAAPWSPEGLAGWEERIRRFEARTPLRFPLAALEARLGLAFPQRMALVLAGLADEDSRFGTLFAELQDPLGLRRPGLELIGRILRDGAGEAAPDPWTWLEPLLEAGLLEAPDPARPRSEWVLQPAALAWDHIRGLGDPRLPTGVEWHDRRSFPPLKSAIVPPDLAARLLKVPSLIRRERPGAICLRSMEGSNRVDIMGSLARSLRRNLLLIPRESLEGGRPRWLAALCAFRDAWPVFVAQMAPGESWTVPALPGFRSAVGILTGQEGGLQGEAAERAVFLTLPFPSWELRLRFWKEGFAGREVEDLEAVASRFLLPGGHIVRTARMAGTRAALEGREAVGLADVREASRALNRQALDNLAGRVESRGDWSDLVTGPAVAGKLRELELRCRLRERVDETLGQAFAARPSKGVKALFSGPSGTGKTLAAQILAARLEMDLYRVDLSSVINKYIGETEKNLHRILSRAEELDVILLLDEGDALLGNRTDVKSANDRYANLETNFLLQRLEAHRGIVFITTNASRLIDQAFQRRLDVIVPFTLPRAPERLALWELHLPPGPAGDSSRLQEAAMRCEFTGGQIRNAAYYAALLARDDGSSAVEMRHLLEAIANEYRKAGSLNPMASPAPTAGSAAGSAGHMEDFLQSLRAGEASKDLYSGGRSPA